MSQQFNASRNFQSLWAVVISVLINFNAYSQNKSVLQVTPKSPNVAQLDKYVNVPVSLNTGTIKQSIPLYEIKTGSVTIPINLNYHNNGLKPDDIPSWVGLGWSLSTGGVISYSQKGLNDFDAQKGMHPFGQAQLNKYFANQMSALEKQFFFEDIIAGNIDSEYDEYFYSLPESNGSFHFVNSNTARVNPKADILITKTASGFKLVNDDGNSYFFESKESISSQATSEISPDFSDNSAYHLTKIITLNGAEVNFTYKQYSFQYTKTSTYISHSGFTSQQCSPSTINGNDVITYVTYLLPDEIQFPEGLVRFNHTQELRKDILKINPSSNVPSLKSIEVFNTNNVKLKEISFGLSYFGINDKLRLDSVTELASGTVGKTWSFNYYGQTSSFPPFDSKARDHWGYANSNTSSSAIPRADYASLLPFWQTYNVSYADRTSDFNSSIKGVLKSIIYPTGGKSEFEYEANQFKLTSYSDFPFTPFMELPGGSFNTTIIAKSATGGNSYQGSFTVPETGYYRISSFKKLSPDPLYADASVTVNGPSQTAIMSKINQCNSALYQCVSYSELIYILAGTYTYSVSGSYYQNSEGATFYLDASLELYKENQSVPLPYFVGGNRITKITSTDGLTLIPLVQKYVYSDSLKNVSFKQVPYYVTSIEESYQVTALGCNSCAGNKFTIHDQSIWPMVGSVIEYGSVTEYTDATGLNGKTENSFLTSENIGGALSEPAVSPVNSSWRSGSLTDKKQYSANATSPLNEIHNSFASDYSGSQINGLKVNYSFYCSALSQRTYRTNISTLISENFKQILAERDLSATTGTIHSTENYSYNSTTHNKPSNEVFLTSKGTSVTKRTTYAFDYDNLNSANTAQSKAIKLLNDNFSNYPIEIVEIKTIDGLQYVTGGSLNIYKENQPVIDRVYSLKLLSPVPITTFLFSKINSSGSFEFDTRYELLSTFDYYDEALNLLQTTTETKRQSYQWGYNELYPIAKMDGAGVNQFYHENFEEVNDFDGSVVLDTTRSHTGKFSGKMVNMGSSELVSHSSQWKEISQTGPRKFKFSGWVYSDGPSAQLHLFMRKLNETQYFTYVDDLFFGETGKWVFHEKEFTVPADVHTVNLRIDNNGGGTVWFDDLKFHPSPGQMTTYTYQPLVGMTSQIDPRGETTYYEYDSFQRLHIVRDQHRNIVKTYCYNYAGQLTDCSSSLAIPQPEGVPSPCSPNSTLPCNALELSLPVNLTFNQAVPNTIADNGSQGLGFTMVQAYSGTRPTADGTVSNGDVPGYEVSKLTLNNGQLQIVSNKGIAYLTNNNQLNALGVKFNSQNNLKVETVLINPFYGTSAQQAGIWMGQDDGTFIKLVVVGNKLEFRKEVNNASTTADMRETAVISGLNTQTVTLRIEIDQATQMAEAFYSVDGTTFTNVGAGSPVSGLSLSGMALTGGTTFAGIYATHRNSSTPVTYTFDNFSVTEVSPASPCFPSSTLPCSALEVSLPLSLNFNQAVANTMAAQNNQGTGFTLVNNYSGTRLSVDGTPENSDVPAYQPSRLTQTGGHLQILSNKGISYLTNNNQLNALGVKFNSQSKYQVETAVINPYNGTLAQQGGIWIGQNDLTFLKLVVVGNKLEFRKEVNDVSGSGTSDILVTSVISGLDAQTVRLRIIVDPATAVAEGYYSTDGITYTKVGTTGFDVSGMGITGATTSGGIFATHRSSSTAVTYSFDSFSITRVN